MLTQLLMLQHADTAFPSGGFAFSNGIEGLAGLGRPMTPMDLANAIAASLRHRWAGADRVALIRAFRAYDDDDRLARIDTAFEAATLAEPMRAGSKRNGQSLLAAHARLGTPGAAHLRERLRNGQLHGHLPIVQGALWRAVGIKEYDAALMSGYQTASSMTAAAVRLGQIGAIEAQRALFSALALIADIIQQPADDVNLQDRQTIEPEAEAVEPRRTEDAPILTSFIPYIEIAAMRHAAADLRLFAN